MKRRTFLVGSTGLVASSPFGGTWAHALVLPGGNSLPGFLDFELSEDGRQLTIVERMPTEPRENSPAIDGAQLTILAVQFGNDALFSLGRRRGEDNTRHVVYIDKAALGKKTGLRHRLIFKRQSVEALWEMSLRTDAFGDFVRTPTVAFRDFAHGTPLLMTIGGALMRQVLSKISDGRIGARGDGRWVVSVDNRFNWRLSVASPGKASFLALGGRLAGEQVIEMQWRRAASRNGNITEPGLSNPIHQIRILLPLASVAINLVDERKRRFRLKGTTADSQAELCVFHSPIGAGGTLSVSVLSLAQGLIAAGDERGGPAVSSLRVRDLVLLERLVDQDKVRLVLSASVAQEQPEECTTSAGTLLLASLQAIGVANDSAKRANRAQVAAGNDNTSEKNDLERQLKHYLALLADIRPFGDPATLYLAAVTRDRLDGTPVVFQSIAISVALHAIDQALPGCEWSRLRFGVAPRQMLRSPVAAKKGDKQPLSRTSGTALDLVYPMPVALRTDFPSVVSIFPEKGVTLARLSMNRAQLDVASSRGLVDLSYGFRGLSLLLEGAKVVLRPDNGGCQVQRMPDDSLADSRPLLILTLPPQHVLEEAWFWPTQVTEPEKRLDDSLTRAQLLIDRLRAKVSEEDLQRKDVKLLLEGQAESADPFYAVWRAFYRDTSRDQPIESEFFVVTNRDHIPPADWPVYEKWVEGRRKAFVLKLGEATPPPNLMRARLSGPSRLALRVHCAAVSDELDVLGDIPFNWSSLTMLGRLEPAVTRRAELLARPLADGRVPAADRASYDSVDGTTVLDYQGIPGGGRTVFSHMDAVRNSLARLPTSDETSLELVSRLVFSPSQRAIFMTDAPVPRQVFTCPPAAGPTATLGAGYKQLSEPSRLWSLRLLTDGRYGVHASDIRVVATPDYRADALRPWPKGPREAFLAAPPYGNGAPWLMPRSPELPGARVTTDPSASSLGTTVGRMVARWFSADAELWRREAEFRTGLSANDRHQLLLLSSAYGLPVIGKRKPDRDGKSGELMDDSDQFSPDPGYTLAELDPGQAIYAPRTLDVSELSLSALGATFRHDTHFNPPLPALLYQERGAPLDFDGRPAFDGLSICRWEHDSLLGRDLRVRVAYKGYLMPTGHQATFVKLTERRIVQTADNRLRAVQVQRMYITLATPELTFPRLEQPYDGRAWPCAKIIVLDPSAVSIADPYEPSGGRVLNIDVGLAFWPQTAADLTPMKFKLTVSGAPTEVPMMFVDNVAMADPDILARLAGEYNGKTQERIWSFAGAKLPYAAARKSGDTELCTERLNVIVTGRNLLPLPADTWVGKCDLYQTTSALEGAGEPPFFPALEWCDLSLDGVGKLVGGAPPLVRARYDGCYVREGFTPPEGSAQHPNPLDVYLHFTQAGAKLDVGGNGDRTAGLARPNVPLIGQSRVSGPVGHSKPSFMDGPASPGCYPQQAPLCEALTPERYWSITHLFRTTVQAEDAKSGLPPQSTGRRAVAKQFFDPQATLLGTITFEDLFELVDDSGALADVLPVLEQALDFGLAVDEAAGEMVKQIREHVLLPLSSLLQAFEQQWIELERQLQDRKGAATEALQGATLTSLFPLLAVTRERLRQRLDEAIGEEDPVQLPGKLSALQVAAGEFLQALSDFARRPLETFVAGVRSLLDGKMGDVRAALASAGVPVRLAELLHTLAKGPDTFEQALRERLAQTLADALKERIEAGLPEHYRLIPLPDLPRLLQSDADEYAAIFEQSLGAIKVDNNTLQQALLAQLQQPDSQPIAFAEVLIDALMAVTLSIIAKVRNSNTLSSKTQALRLLETYRLQLLALRNELARSPLGTRVQLILERINAERAVLDRYFDQLGQLKTAIDKGNLADAIQALSNLGLALGGPIYLDPSRALANQMTSIARQTAQLFEQLPTPAQASVDACEAMAHDPRSMKPILDLGAIADAPLQQIRELIVSIEPLPGEVDDFEKIFDQEQADLRAITGVGGAKPGESIAISIEQGIASTRQFLTDLQSDAASLFCEVVRLEQASKAIYLADSPSYDGAAIFARLVEVQVILETMLRVLGNLLSKLANYSKHQGALLLVGLALLELAGLSSHPAAQKILAAALALRQKTTDFADHLLGALNALLGQLDILVGIPLQGLYDALGTIKGLQELPAGVLDGPTKQMIASAREDLMRVQQSFQPFEPAPPGTDDSPLDHVLQARRVDQLTLAQVLAGADPLAGAEHAWRAGAQTGLRLFQHLKYRIDGLPSVVLKRLEPFAADYLNASGKSLRQVYGSLFKAREALIDWLKKNASWLDAAALDAALSPPEGTAADQDALVVEIQLLDRLPAYITLANLSATRSVILELAEFWSSGQAAPLLIFKGLQSLVERVMRGDVLSVIDISGLRDEIEDRISALVPTRQTLSYDFGVSLGAPKKSNALFAPQPGCRFEVSVRSQVDLLKPEKFSFETKGSIGAFNINLVHEFGVDAVSLIFGGATFRMARGEKVVFDADFQDFVIGDALKFIQQLQESLSIGASGAFLEPLRGIPGIRAGYGLDIGVITLGALSFCNVTVAIAADLPFSNNEALFSVALGRRLSPFMISALPWAGSGYLAILSTAQAIVGFEMGLEFGVGGAFKFGPLVGQGRIQAGFAIRTVTLESGKRVTEISGTFFAGGSANIWIFTFAACLYVRLTMDSESGKMQGEAVFAFSFKVGFAQFSYQVRAHYSQDKLSNDKGQAKQGTAQFYERDPYLEIADIGTASGARAPRRDQREKSTTAPRSNEAARRTTSIKKNWQRYSQYFDDELLR